VHGKGRFGDKQGGKEGACGRDFGGKGRSSRPGVHACDELGMCADQVEDLVAFFASFPSALLSQGASERARARGVQAHIYACERPCLENS
jgi:hypothetical protein